jgi:N-acetylglucosaminyldiphosphoundecaprenol N-acetyl-beta-D-mannosaminyltransferase
MSLNQIVKIMGYPVFCGNEAFFSSNFKGVVNTISPHSYMVAKKDRIFHAALLASDFIIPDGIGIVFAIRIITARKIRKIAGADLHDILIKALNNRKGSCFYLGSSEITLKKITERHSIEHPELRVYTFSPPYKQEFNEEDNLIMIDAINKSKSDVLFVGMTAPKQEKWVFENKHLLNTPVICSIGAVFDFYAGTVKRPGKFWISLGLEWLPRLVKEPQRLWKRTFISSPLFIWFVLKEKIKLSFQNLTSSFNTLCF